jgi:hypothetical protein
MRQCIYCGTGNLLNTQLTITLDDGIRHTVDICDEHAEDASIKSAKAAYQDKQSKIKLLLEQAALLGLNITEAQSGLVILEQSPPEETTPEPEEPPAKPIRPNTKQISPTDLEAGFISTDVVDHRNRPIASPGANTQMGNVESHVSYDTSQARGALPEDALKGKVKMTVVEGREGQPLAVPQQRIDGTGTTRININKTENDQKLQERFKKMAQSSITGQAPDFAKSGYSNTTATCPVCRGNGSVNMGKSSQSCPKCGGSGIISVF